MQTGKRCFPIQMFRELMFSLIMCKLVQFVDSSVLAYFRLSIHMLYASSVSRTHAYGFLMMWLDWNEVWTSYLIVWLDWSGVSTLIAAYWSPVLQRVHPLRQTLENNWVIEVFLGDKALWSVCGLHWFSISHVCVLGDCYVGKSCIMLWVCYVPPPSYPMQ